MLKQMLSTNILIIALISVLVSFAGGCQSQETIIVNMAATGDLSQIKTMLASNPELVNARALHDITPLHVAAFYGHKDVVEHLIAHGEVVDAKTSQGPATGTGRGVVWHENAGSGSTPLHFAAWQGHRDIAELLIAKGANVNAKNAFDRTPLHWATVSGDCQLADFLISKGAQVNAWCKDGFTKWSLGDGTSGFIEIPHQGIFIDINKQEVTPLHLAIHHGHSDVAELLVSKGADVNAKIHEDWTMMHFVALYDQRNVAELLIAKGGNVNAKKKDGETPLHFVSSEGHRDVAELFIAKGAKVSAKTNKGDTPLHYAVSAGRMEVAELLIAAGADVNAKNNKGETTLYIATYWYKNKKVADFLRQHGGVE